MLILTFGIINLIVIAILIIKSGSKIYEFDKISEFTCINHFSNIMGNKAKIIEEIRMFSGDNNSSTIVLEIIKKNCKRYLVLWIVASFTLVFLGVTSIQSIKEVNYLKRPEPDKPTENISLVSEATIGEDKYTNNSSIKLIPKSISEQKQKEILSNFINTIPEIIRGENEDLMRVVKPLNLLIFDSKTGIAIEWATSDKKIIENDGFVYSLNLNNPTKVMIYATFRLNDLEAEKIYMVNVINGNEKSYIEKIINRDSEKISKEINSGTNNEYLFLPTRDSFGNKLSWSKDYRSFEGNAILLLIIIFLFIFITRHKEVTNKSKKYRSSILKELPSFVSKLILLINAGLVVSAALEKIAFEYESNIRKQSIIPIYEEILLIEYKVIRTKSSLSLELKNLGERTSIRELSRFASIIGENINKGSELVDKLESEGEILWSNRKKQVEEKARLAETKMTLPLLILLIILITITIAPVLLNF